MKTALQALLDQHDALRMSFSDNRGTLRQHNRDAGEPVAFTVSDLSAHGEPARALAEIGDRLQRSLDLNEGPLFRAALFHLAANDDRLLLIDHPLIIDGVSWRILIEDLASAYRQALEGRLVVALPPKSTSFQEWAEHLYRYGQSPGLQQEAEYWKGVLQNHGGFIEE